MTDDPPGAVPCRSLRSSRLPSDGSAPRVGARGPFSLGRASAWGHVSPWPDVIPRPPIGGRGASRYLFKGLRSGVVPLREAPNDVRVMFDEPPRSMPESEAARRIAGAAICAIARLAVRDAEHRALQEVLGRVRWNRAAAARVLNVSDETLRTRLAECDVPHGGPPASS